MNLQFLIFTIEMPKMLDFCRHHPSEFTTIWSYRKFTIVVIIIISA